MYDSRVEEWLAQWGDLTAPGKHSRMEPALFAGGYKYNPVPNGPVYTMWCRVNRAIPVDGTVEDPPPSWWRSPQARFWLEKEKVSLWKQIVSWLKKPL